MSLPLLIIGGTKEAREEKALEIAKKASSVFDINIFNTQDAGGIDTIRALNQKLTRRPYDSSQQSIILLEAQSLTIEAQNAFLKNLEEGSSSAQIVLTAATSEGLLSTVTSRCQKMDLPTQNEVLTKGDWQFLSNFLQSGTYQRYTATDKLDLDRWLFIWRKILLASLGSEQLSFSFTTSPASILRYLRLINKLRHLQKKRAAPRLLKTILILETPRIEIKTTADQTTGEKSQITNPKF